MRPHRNQIPLFEVPAVDPQDNCEWYTPRDIIDKATEVMGCICIDPSSCDQAQQVVQAEKYFTQVDDGLSQPWAGNVWLNPPYGRGIIEQWADKLIEHVKADHVDQAIVLTHNCTETGWWQQLAYHSLAICYPAHWLKFWGPLQRADNNPRGQTLFYLCSDKYRYETFCSSEDAVLHFTAFDCFGIVTPGGAA